MALKRGKNFKKLFPRILWISKYIAKMSWEQVAEIPNMDIKHFLSRP